jgi:ABC-type glutathione transport system ATPase component
MNADSIIVVVGGELVEQGSHDDLISAGGKYAELWSKQVFTKTKEQDEGASQGRRAKTTSLVNDLTPEATDKELAKVRSVKSAPTPLHLMCKTNDTKANGAKAGNREVKTPGGHKKEV